MVILKARFRIGGAERHAVLVRPFFEQKLPSEFFVDVVNRPDRWILRWLAGIPAMVT